MIKRSIFVAMIAAALALPAFALDGERMPKLHLGPVEEMAPPSSAQTPASAAALIPAVAPAPAPASVAAAASQEAAAADAVVAAAAEAPAQKGEGNGKGQRAPRLELAAEQTPLDFPDTTVSLKFKDMDIVEALKFIAEKANINIIPTKDVQGKVTLDVSEVSVKDVFGIVMRSNNLAYEKKGNIYNVMTEKEYKDRYGKDFYDQRITKVFRLQYAIPDQVLNLLNTLKSEIGKVLLDADSGVILVMDTPEKVREMQETLDAMDRKGIIRVFDLKYARAKDIEEQLKSQLDTKKVGSIKSDERTNQVIVQTLPERMEDIARLIQGLDTKTRQILIDAKIVQVKLRSSTSSGVEWEGLFKLGNSKSGLSYLGSTPFSSVQSTTDSWRSRLNTYNTVGEVGSYPFSGTTTSYNSSIPKVASQEMHLGVINKTNDFDVVLKYLETIGETKILSNPKLAVVNNQEAKIHVGTRQAYITTTTTQTQTSTTVAEAVTYVDVGIQLVVTPTINVDGFVTVKIKPEISSVIDYLKTSSNNQIPIVDTSTAETIVMVKDGTSILIGGLSKEDKTQDQSGTPFLSKIPVIGAAFRSATKTTSRYELVVLLTPHVVSGDELVTGSGSTDISTRDKAYQAYQDFREDKETVGYKTYQTYPLLAPQTGGLPGIKPERNL
ncbi:MAG: secretin N-terminal domain-containing protein [Deltaproteobacteria bacterium]